MKDSKDLVTWEILRYRKGEDTKLEKSSELGQIKYNIRYIKT